MTKHPPAFHKQLYRLLSLNTAQANTFAIIQLEMSTNDLIGFDGVLRSKLSSYLAMQYFHTESNMKSSFNSTSALLGKYSSWSSRNEDEFALYPLQGFHVDSMKQYLFMVMSYPPSPRAPDHSAIIDPIHCHGQNSQDEFLG